ncbi:MAG: hypothetical protein ACRCUQ_04685 [Alphaproteobacteria bacterium]
MLNDFSFHVQSKLSRLRHFFFPSGAGEGWLDASDCLLILGLSIWLTLSAWWEDADEGDD